MLSRVSRLSRFTSPSLFRFSRSLSSFNPTGGSSTSSSNESRQDLSRKMDQRQVYDVNDDMQDPITHSNSSSRQNLKAQTVSDSDEKTSPELEAALHSSYME